MKFLKKNGIAILLLLLLSSFVGCKPEASETPAEPSEFTVTFNAGIVNLPEVKRTFKKGESFSFMYEFNAVENYTFAGWSTKPDSKEVNFNIGDKFTVNSDVTFYAVWNKDLTMTFKAGIVKLPQKTY